MTRKSEADLVGGNKPAYGWSSSGFITVAPTGNPAPNEKFVNGVVGLQIGFPIPGYYTVQFNVVQIDPPAINALTNPLVVKPRAEIIWSVKGNSVRRVLDVTDGACVSGTGENVAITVNDASLDTAGIFDNTYKYFVNIQVTPGLRPIQGGVQPPSIYAKDGFYGANAIPFDASVPFAIGNPATTLDTRTSVLIPENVGINSYLLNICNLGTVDPVPVLGNFTVTQSGGNPGFDFPLSIVNYDSLNKWQPIWPGAKIILINNTFDNSNPSKLLGSILFGIEG